MFSLPPVMDGLEIEKPKDHSKDDLWPENVTKNLPENISEAARDQKET